MPDSKVLESAKYISENSEDVFIIKDGIESAARFVLKTMKERNYCTKTWRQHALNPNVADRSAVDWIFVVDTLNFSFWSETNKSKDSNKSPFYVEHKGVRYTGYWALPAAINNALDKGIPFTDARYLASASSKDIAEPFMCETDDKVPMVLERVETIKNAAKVLVEKFDGSFANCIKQANGSAMKLLDILIENFDSYRDIQTYKEKKVYFLKRAQILIGDIWACFDGEDYGKFHDIDSITMFADYRVPQVLYQLGILGYSNNIIEKLNDNEAFDKGSNFELEIRGNSIWVVEQLLQRIKQLDPEYAINAILLDFFLWDYAKEIESTMKIPIHLTRSIYY